MKAKKEITKIIAKIIKSEPSQVGLLSAFIESQKIIYPICEESNDYNILESSYGGK